MFDDGDFSDDSDDSLDVDFPTDRNEFLSRHRTPTMEYNVPTGGGSIGSGTELREMSSDSDNDDGPSRGRRPSTEPLNTEGLRFQRRPSMDGVGRSGAHRRPSLGSLAGGERMQRRRSGSSDGIGRGRGMQRRPSLSSLATGERMQRRPSLGGLANGERMQRRPSLGSLANGERMQRRPSFGSLANAEMTPRHRSRSRDAISRSGPQRRPSLGSLAGGVSYRDCLERRPSTSSIDLEGTAERLITDRSEGFQRTNSLSQMQQTAKETLPLVGWDASTATSSELEEEQDKPTQHHQTSSKDTVSTNEPQHQPSSGSLAASVSYKDKLEQQPSASSIDQEGSAERLGKNKEESLQQANSRTKMQQTEKDTLPLVGWGASDAASSTDEEEPTNDDEDDDGGEIYEDFRPRGDFRENTKSNVPEPPLEEEFDSRRPWRKAPVNQRLQLKQATSETGSVVSFNMERKQDSGNTGEDTGGEHAGARQSFTDGAGRKGSMDSNDYEESELDEIEMAQAALNQSVFAFNGRGTMRSSLNRTLDIYRASPYGGCSDTNYDLDASADAVYGAKAIVADGNEDTLQPKGAVDRGEAMIQSQSFGDRPGPVPGIAEGNGTDQNGKHDFRRSSFSSSSGEEDEEDNAAENVDTGIQLEVSPTENSAVAEASKVEVDAALLEKALQHQQNQHGGADSITATTAQGRSESSGALSEKDTPKQNLDMNDTCYGTSEEATEARGFAARSPQPQRGSLRQSNHLNMCQNSNASTMQDRGENSSRLSEQNNVHQLSVISIPASEEANGDSYAGNDSERFAGTSRKGEEETDRRDSFQAAAAVATATVAAGAAVADDADRDLEMFREQGHGEATQKVEKPPSYDEEEAYGEEEARNRFDVDGNINAEGQHMSRSEQRRRMLEIAHWSSSDVVKASNKKGSDHDWPSFPEHEMSDPAIGTKRRSTLVGKAAQRFSAIFHSSVFYSFPPVLGRGRIQRCVGPYVWERRKTILIGFFLSLCFIGGLAAAFAVMKNDNTPRSDGVGPPPASSAPSESTISPVPFPSASPTLWPSAKPTATPYPTMPPQPLPPPSYTKVQTIEGDKQNDFVGFSTSFSSDGTYLAVGFKQANGIVPNSGVARVYQLEDGSWSSFGGDIPGSAFQDEFGMSLSLSDNGHRIAVGAPKSDDAGSSSGHVKVFEYSKLSSTWEQIGSNIQGVEAQDRAGFSVALSGKGNRVAVGAPRGGNNTGSVRVFEDIGTDWVQIGQDLFGNVEKVLAGYSCSLSHDGDIVAMGVLRSSSGGLAKNGHVSIYRFFRTEATESWQKVGEDIVGENAGDQNGMSVSLSSDASLIAIGANGYDHQGVTNVGYCRVFRYENGSWSQLGLSLRGSLHGEQSGFSVSLSRDGMRVACGAANSPLNGDRSGVVRVYERSQDEWAQIGDVLSSSEGAAFGYSVSLTESGGYLAVGAPEKSANGVDNIGCVDVYMLE